MKILIDMSQFSEKHLYYSITVYIMRFLDAIPNIARKDITLLIPREEFNYLENRYPDFNYTFYSGYEGLIKNSKKVKKEIEEYKKIIYKEKYDCIFIPADMEAYSCFKFNTRKIIVIYDLKAISTEDLPRELRDEKKKGYEFVRKWLRPLILRAKMNYIVKYYKKSLLSADTIIAISQYTKNDILRKFPLISQDKIKVIYCSVPTVTNSKAPIKINGSKKYILYVNTLEPYKNVLTLISAYQLKEQIYNEYNLVIVGKSTEYWKNVFNNKVDDNLKGKIIHLENLSNEELKWLYENAALFVSTSIHEGFGYTPIEAAIYKCPVICSTCEALPDTTMNLLNYYTPVMDKIALYNKMVEVLNMKNNQLNLNYISDNLKKAYNTTIQAQKILDVLYDR